MKYAIRWSDRIEEDIQRGFSGWQGGVWTSLLEALRFHGLEVSEDSMADAIEEGEILVEGFHFREFRTLWFAFHHEGLSCFELEELEDCDTTEAISMAKNCYRDDEYSPVGDGYRTIGQVEIIACLQEPSDEEMGCYLIRCEDVAPN